jgi:hypothetical protein
VLALKDARRVAVHGRQSPKIPVFARVDGKQSGGIRLFGNELSEAGPAAQTGPETSAEAVKVPSG